MKDHDRRAAVAALIHDCLDDPSLSPILADLIDDDWLSLSAALRTGCHLIDLWTAASFVGRAGRRCYRACWREVDVYAREVRACRNAGNGPALTHPEMQGGTDTIPSIREAEGGVAYLAWLTTATPTMRGRSLRSFAHCRRLCLLALRGEDAPPDVQVQCGYYVSRIRALLRALKYPEPSGGAADSVVLTKP